MCDQFYGHTLLPVCITLGVVHLMPRESKPPHFFPQAKSKICRGIILSYASSTHHDVMVDLLTTKEIPSWGGTLYTATTITALVAATATVARLWLERRLASTKPIPGLPSPSQRPHWLIGHFKMLQKELPEAYREAMQSAGEKGRLGLWFF